MRLERFPIVKSFLGLEGNTRVAVSFFPFWAIPFALYNFYLSLYMKSRGLDGQQLGYILSITFITSALVSFFGSNVVDYLGRKKSAMIVDLVFWPTVALLWILADRFWIFALAAMFQSAGFIGNIAFNCVLAEDATDEQRLSAYNLINVIFLASGVLTPLAGILVNSLGIIRAEQMMIGLYGLSMMTLGILRNRYLTETKNGQRILEDRRKHGFSFHHMLHLPAIRLILRSPGLRSAMLMWLLFNAFAITGSFQSMYYVPYLTEVLHLNKSLVSVMGGVLAGVMLLSSSLLVPEMNKRYGVRGLPTGFAILLGALLLFICLPPGNFLLALACVTVYGVGFSLVKPMVEATFSNAAMVEERVSVYAINNLLTCSSNALMGALAGSLYNSHPGWLYRGSLVIVGVMLVVSVGRVKGKCEGQV